MPNGLVKLILLTRFSKLYIIFLAFSVMVSIVLAFDLSLVGSLLFRAIFVGVSLFFIYYFVYTASIPILRSDVDFLFTSPINDQWKAVSLYISKYVFVGLSILDTLLWAAGPVSTSPLGRYAIIISLIALSFIVTSLSVIASTFTVVKRVLIAISFMLFTLLYLVLSWYTVPYLSVLSDISNFHIDIVSIIMVLVLPLVLVFYAIRVLGNVNSENLGQIAPHLDTRTFLNTHNRTEKEENISFNNIQASEAMIKFSLSRSHSTLTGKNFSSDNVVRISQGPTLKFALVTGIALAVIVGVLGFLSHFYMLLLTLFPLIILIIAIYTLLGITFTHSINALSLERGWLSFTSVSPREYVGYLILARMIKTVLVSTPIGVVLVFLHFIYGLNTVGVAYLEFFVVPLLIMPIFLLNVSLGTFQIRDPAFITPQRKARQFLDMGPITALIVIAAVSITSVNAIIYISAIVLASDIFLFFEKNLWIKVVFRVTESGYI
ncbi:MAG: hypothetical protein LVQ96_01675 [Thermoplasmatales archaeon]|nr:hypothetical protein [Thermoplasmatales archaeon]MCW6169863.1 hypothetical protein [Thermoplasmatales archaeon]